MKSEYGLYICCAASLSASLIACKLALDNKNTPEAEYAKTIITEIEKSEVKTQKMVKEFYDRIPKTIQECKEIQNEITREKLSNLEEFKRLLKSSDNERKEAENKRNELFKTFIDVSKNAVDECSKLHGKIAEENIVNQEKIRGMIASAEVEFQRRNDALGQD